MSDESILDRARREPWNYGGALLSMYDALLARLTEACGWLEEYRDLLMDERPGTDGFVTKHCIGAWLDDFRNGTASSAAVVRKRKSCPRCYGKSPLCHRCQGTGMIDAPTSADDPSCPECDGEGHE